MSNLWVTGLGLGSEWIPSPVLHVHMGSLQPPEDEASPLHLPAMCLVMMDA